MAAKRILLIHLYSNGDCLYATTIAKQVKVDFPGCHLTWAIATHCKAILDNNPFVDEIMEVSVAGTDSKVFDDLLLQAESMERNNEIDKVIVSQIIGDNYSKYDGCVRTSIYRCYDAPITVDKIPVLNLTAGEHCKAKMFAFENKFDSFKNVILFECAPLSGQVSFTQSFITELAAGLAKDNKTAVILSSAKKIPVDLPGVFDGSVLTIRETAALSHYCTLLLGCSSGITWATVSSGAQQLPMVQLLNKDSYIYNPPSIAFKNVGDCIDTIIEIFDLDVHRILECISVIKDSGFARARKIYNQKAKKQFKVYRGITHKFLVQKKYKLLKSFIKMNIQVHGLNLSMLAMILKGIILYPAQIIADKKQSLNKSV